MDKASVFLEASGGISEGGEMGSPMGSWILRIEVMCWKWRALMASRHIFLSVHWCSIVNVLMIVKQINMLDTVYKE